MDVGDEADMAELNSPLILGGLHLKNRVVMAPLTRSRATDERVPTAMMAEYYRQRRPDYL